MKLVEKHYIQKNHKYFKECDKLSFLAKNLYNYANYLVRKEFIENKIWLKSPELQKILQGQQVDYLALPAKVSSQVLRLLEKNWKSFFKAIKDWKKHPDKYLGRPRLPRYKHKTKGRQVVIYDVQAINKRKLNKEGIVKLSKTNIEIPFINNFDDNKIKQARIVHMNQFQYCIEIVYETIIQSKVLNKENYIGVDLGLNNLCTIGGNKVKPFIIEGKVIKSINQYYNKLKAKLQSKLPKNRFTSNRIIRLTNKRDHKINDYLHKVSKYIIDFCLTNDVGKIVIGYNSKWKQNINIGKKNNQKFVGIPFLKLVNMIVYKAELVGIEVVLQEESYTSKCSFIDNEKVCRHQKYQGKRIKRGLFKSAKKLLINADINGMYNILRKAIVNFSIKSKEIIEVVAVQPIRINPYKLTQ